MKGLVKRCKMYACENLRAEINHFQPEGIDIEYLDFGYHRHPGKLPPVLQERLERDREYDAILLGYGLCSKAVRGVRAVHQPLVIPGSMTALPSFWAPKGCTGRSLPKTPIFIF